MILPIIGIVPALLENTPSPGASFVGHRQTYLDAVAAAKGVPVFLPVTEDPLILRAAYELSSGIVFAGGGDVCTTRYGGTHHAKMELDHPLREEIELQLLEWILCDGKPFFGICRGAQLLNVALGGTLIESLEDHLGHKAHMAVGSDRWTRVVHEMPVAAGSRFEQIVGESIEVNSLHTQAIRLLGRSLVGVAVSGDGVIEIVERDGFPFCIGVQGHPEALAASGNARWQKVFAAFVQAARSFAA